MYQNAVGKETSSQRGVLPLRAAFRFARSATTISSTSTRSFALSSFLRSFTAFVAHCVIAALAAPSTTKPTASQIKTVFSSPMTFCPAGDI